MDQDQLIKLILSSRNYYSHLSECIESWTKTFEVAHEMERDLITLSGQLRCLHLPNQCKLSEDERKKTAGRIILLMEEKYSKLVESLNGAMKMQQEVTALYFEAEKDYLPLRAYCEVKSLLRLTHETYNTFKFWSATVNAAIIFVNYKNPDTIKLLMESVYALEKEKHELRDLLQNAEYLLRTLESSL